MLLTYVCFLKSNRTIATGRLFVRGGQKTRFEECARQKAPSIEPRGSRDSERVGGGVGEDDRPPAPTQRTTQAGQIQVILGVAKKRFRRD